MIALLVVGVAVPTPGAIGGFHEAFRFGATMFYGAPDDAAVGAAIVLHVFSIGPSLLLGLLFAAQAGLNFARCAAGRSGRAGAVRVAHEVPVLRATSATRSSTRAKAKKAKSSAAGANASTAASASRATSGSTRFRTWS